MTTIYIVKGETDEGGGSNFQTWDVAAYTTFEEAEKHQMKCIDYVDDGINYSGKHKRKDPNPYDPKMKVSCGVEYVIDTTKLLENME